jgi:hypothetical protein
MYLQLFPIYGLMFGVNYWNTTMDDEPALETEHLFQIMIGIIGISFHYWTQND